MLKYAFEAYKFERIKVEVPLYAHHTMDAVERLGFVLEGRLRRAILYHEKWFDLNIYSVLPSDLTKKGEKGEVKRNTVCFECGGRFTLVELVRKTEKRGRKKRKVGQLGQRLKQGNRKEVSDGRA